MPPLIATLIFFSFIVFLFVWDTSTTTERPSGALWLPVLWMVITGSRFVSQWMNLGQGVPLLYEGTLVDVAYFLTLILAAIAVLAQRHVSIGELARNNRWMFAFFVFSFIAILWSDFHYISFKRWIKALGPPAMALIILTDANPQAALRTVMKRCAFVLLPLSMLLIKYYPDIGRNFDSFSGKGVNNGAGLTKNDLGYVCMIFGVFFFWNLLTARHLSDRRLKKKELLQSGLLLLMVVWLLRAADSATSLVSALIGVGTIAALGRASVKRHIGTYLVVTALTVATLEITLDAYSGLLHWLGRDPTLTDRTEIWADVLEFQDSPILGAGYDSFWLGDRLDAMWATWWWHPIQSHNGYIETYMNLGGVGLFLLVCVLLSAYAKARGKLSTDYDFARLRLGFLFAIIAFNFTEAAFKGIHLVFTLFYIIALDYPSRAVVLKAPQKPARLKRRTVKAHSSAYAKAVER